MEHGTWKDAFGYLVEAGGKRIVISGDTRPSPELERVATHADILIHEVYPAERLAAENRPGGSDWPAYMRSFHTSDRELGAIAMRAQVKLLILYHIVRTGASDAELLAGVRAGGFTGKVAVGKDLNRY